MGRCNHEIKSTRITGTPASVKAWGSSVISPLAPLVGVVVGGVSGPASLYSTKGSLHGW